MKQQERSPFTTEGKSSFAKNYFCMVITFVFTMKARFVEIYHFSYIYALIL